MNVSSTAGRRGVTDWLGYAAWKFGVSGHTQTMSLELAPLGIRVNAVAPGMIHTPMTDVMFQDPENVKRIRASHPIGREGQAEEVCGRDHLPAVRRLQLRRRRGASRRRRLHGGYPFALSGA